jgi:predicted HAD superfamily Cof-like phosphohydrolase
MTLAHGKAVKHFHQLMGQPAPDKPGLISDERWELRTDLIVEEFKEIDEAWEKGDLVALADGCADLVYVVIGMAVEFGIPFDKVFEEVNRSNMAKSSKCERCAGHVGYVVDGDKWAACPDCGGTQRIVKYSEAGKVLKPEGWTPPEIQRIMEEAAGGEGT